MIGIERFTQLPVRAAYRTATAAVAPAADFGTRWVARARVHGRRGRRNLIVSTACLRWEPPSSMRSSAHDDTHRILAAGRWSPIARAPWSRMSISLILLQQFASPLHPIYWPARVARDSRVQAMPRRPPRGYRTIVRSPGSGASRLDKSARQLEQRELVCGRVSVECVSHLMSCSASSLCRKTSPCFSVSNGFNRPCVRSDTHGATPR